ncbi:MAG: GNAT family N-acetyltransferase [Kiritimatiellae bacterium]|nr:GNAT family N-acetyltransferase [Kiritimatiellia bacterium]
MSDGTEPAFSIRPARCGDARAVYALIRANADALLVRSLSNVLERVDRFLVAEAEDGAVVGAVCYGLWPEIGDELRTSAELQSVCVDAAWRRRGVGRALVEAQIARLRALHVGQIVVLTYATAFFAGLGFREIDKHEIMYKLYTGCMNCPKHDDPFTCPERAMALWIQGGGRDRASGADARQERLVVGVERVVHGEDVVDAAF